MNESTSFLTTYKLYAKIVHIGQERMTRLTRENLIGNLAKVTFFTCNHCLLGKQRENQNNKDIFSIAISLLRYLLLNECESKTRTVYFITFIDDFLDIVISIWSSINLKHWTTLDNNEFA